MKTNYFNLKALFAAFLFLAVFTSCEDDLNITPEDNQDTLASDLFANEERDDDIDTLGGLVFSLAGRVPVRGEVITHPSGLEIEVLVADPRRIKTLKIVKK